MPPKSIAIDRPRQHVGRKDLIDEDNTFLPPALSSYSIALLNEKNIMTINSTNKPVTINNTNKPTITGIYELDFPEQRDRLRQKLSVHFNEYNDIAQHDLFQISLVPELSNVTSKSNYLSDNSTHNTLTHNTSTHNTSIHEDSPSGLSNPLLTLTNSLSGNVSNHNFCNSPHNSLSSGQDEFDNGLSSRNSNDLKIVPIRRLRGRRFGKSLGPPQRGKFSQEAVEHKPDIQKLPSMTTQQFNDDENMSMNRLSKSPLFSGLNLNYEKELEFRERIDHQKKLIDVKHSISEIDNTDKRKPLLEVSSNQVDSFRKPKIPKLNTHIFKSPETKSLPKLEQPSAQVVSQNLDSISEQKLNLPPAVLNSIQTRKPERNVGLNHTPVQNIDEETCRKKTININGNQYEKLEVMGRGGTSKVYKAKQLSTNKVYAIKKVTFDQFDESCIKGFKGEIDLLIKLKDSSRVVRLIDYAIGEGSIYLVMECGEIDLAHALQNRLNFNKNQLDINFVKFHVIEIFKCVEAVHNSGIVHSDLKPANFLFVKGILKIIDFGIADSVPDHTANVYRDSQMGTPSYMAPETLININHLSNSNNEKNTWKVGKPSDIWSCGCIIYQMIYGKPPYGAYSGNQRIMAILNPLVKIQYPSKGIGDVKVPKSAIELMKNCLARNPEDRWTLKQCLESDFLHPKIVDEGFIRDLVHLAVNFGYNNRMNQNGFITSDVYDKLVDTILKQIDGLNIS